MKLGRRGGSPAGGGGQPAGRAGGRAASAGGRAAGERPDGGRAEPPIGIARVFGEPALFAIASAAVGGSIYFALGLVAGEALALTPLVMLAAGAFFVVTMMTYFEGNSLHPERGGASTFARYAFNELWSFVAGWAILLDYLIVMAIAAFSISHYLGAFWTGAGGPGLEIAVAAVAIGFVAWRNIRGISAYRLSFLARLGLVNLALSAAIVVAGLVLLPGLDTVTDFVEPASAPSWRGLVFAAVVAMVAMTGIEAASGLAGEVRRRLHRVALMATVAVILVFGGISVVALMAVPVVGGSTELGGRLIEAPVLGVVDAFRPEWLMEAFRYAVGAVASLVLLEAVNVNLLGLSRLVYSLTTRGQIPYTIGRLHPVRSTPYVAIAAAALIAFVLVLVADIELLAGIFAFGAMLAFAIAHVALIVLRFREPDHPRAFRVPLSIPVGRGSVPLPAAIGAFVAIAAWVSVLLLHEGARVAGGVWMVAGLTLYVAYRHAKDRPLTRRVTIPAEALREARDVEYGRILVPVSGGPLDDDIVGTAGRLAAEEGEYGEEATLDALYVIEVPMSLPLDAQLPEEALDAAKHALSRAKAVGEEYEGVRVDTARVRARSAGAAIVDEARRRGAQAIVLAAEEPSSVRGGVLLGGRGGLARRRERFVGDTTKYVVEKAPCRVVLTAPPADDEVDARTGVAP